jgi:ubiquinone/menaquinone biosynthesis C-methylase UbiE
MIDFTRLVHQEFERAACDGDEYTLPWLDLDVESYRSYREGRSEHLPKPYVSDPANCLMMEHVEGLEVLLLAGGAGQQSAVYGLLGAHVTVFDLMASQLAGDQQAAVHYGYPVTTIQGDMHDLSILSERAYDRVYQPISTLYCYDLCKLYTGVRRVIKPGGLYCTDFAFPLLYMAQNMGWDPDRRAYILAISEPYRRGEILEKDGVASFTVGDPIGEYHHLFSDIINGLVVREFKIRGLWESPRVDVADAELDLPQDIPLHRARYLPYGITVVAEG